MNSNITPKNVNHPVKISTKAKPMTTDSVFAPQITQPPIIIVIADDEELHTHKKMITEKNVVDVTFGTPNPQKTIISKKQPKPEDVALYQGYSLQRLHELEIHCRGLCQKLENSESKKRLRSALASIIAAKDILIKKETIKAAKRYINTIDLLFTGIQSIPIKDSVEGENCDFEMPKPVNNIEYLFALMKTVMIEGPGCQLNKTESDKGFQLNIEDVLKYFYGSSS